MARRYARRHDPVVPRVQKAELSEKNLGLRALIAGFAIMAAIAAFGYMLTTLLTPNTGWQNVEVTNSKTGAATQLSFLYNIGASDLSASAEYRELSLVYTETSDNAYRALSSHEIEHWNNLYTLNTSPNVPVTVDPILYRALETMEADGGRLLYLAPIYAQYQSLLQCTEDVNAEKYDPAFSEGAQEFLEEILSFAKDSTEIQVNLLGGNQVELYVSERYLAYAEANEVDTFIDFGWLKNAFILDEVADEILARGHKNGILTSCDGFTRALGDTEYTMNLYTPRAGTPVLKAEAAYTGPKTVAAFRTFPLLALEEELYYTYEDGTVRTPYMNNNGLLQSAADHLAVFSDSESCAVTALRSLPAFASDRFEPQYLDEFSWVCVQGGEILQDGSGIRVTKIG